MSDKPNDIVISGAGLVGCVCGSVLAKRGYKVTIIEKRNDPRGSQIGGGRSINLAISKRGWTALEEIGLDKKIKEISVAMYGRNIHDHQNGQIFHPYSINKEAIYAVSRNDLNIALIDQAEADCVKFIFGFGCRYVDINAKKMELTNPSTKEMKILRYGLLIGADGAHSTIRRSLFDHLGHYKEVAETSDYGYMELTIPYHKDDLLQKNALHIWPRKKFMLIALPNLDGSFTCTLFMPLKGKDLGFDNFTSPLRLIDFFYNEFNDVFPMMDSISKDFLTNPVSNLQSLKCEPWTDEESILLIGDSAHAILPFYGQGMNAGFEDVMILKDLLNETDDDWPSVLKKFSKSRKKDADAINQLAFDNFTEMRDYVLDKEFNTKKELSDFIYNKIPEKWTPSYSLVSFTNTPYSEALKVKKEQEKILKKIIADLGLTSLEDIKVKEKEIIQMIPD